MIKRQYMEQPQLRQLAYRYYTEQKKKHIQQVLDFARKFKGQQLSPVQLAAIYMHDVAKQKWGQDLHAQKGAQYARRLLKDRYTKEQLKTIVKAIRQHSQQYRQDRGDKFRHSSPQAQLLALADDGNVVERMQDPIPILSKHKQYWSNRDPNLYGQALLQQFKQFWSPVRSHKNLQYYEQPWKEFTNSTADKIQGLTLQDLQDA